LLAKDFLAVAIFIIVGIAFSVIALLAAWLIRPHRPSEEKLTTYECGKEPIGPAWLQFRVGYYIYALVFLIFDVEAVFVFPWAAQLFHMSKNHSLAVLGIVDMLIFVAVLIVGWIWAVKKGVLEWK
jgi:NADH-quinone oxidoreductase subunit A